MTSNHKIGFIPSSLYNQIIELIPIVSVEAVIVIDKGLLLLRRKNEPAIGEWWFPGGRVYKGESLHEALSREVKEETGLEIKSQKLINAYSRVFPQRHDITITYLCKCKEGKVILNKEHSEYSLFKKMPSGLHSYMLETIRDSEWEKYL